MTNYRVLSLPRKGGSGGCKGSSEWAGKGYCRSSDNSICIKHPRIFNQKDYSSIQTWYSPESPPSPSHTRTLTRLWASTHTHTHTPSCPLWHSYNTIWHNNGEIKACSREVLQFLKSVNRDYNLGIMLLQSPI
jgi:hypothetical protein